MKTITPQQLQELLESNETVQVIDVRDEYEYEVGRISDQVQLIPLHEVMHKVHLLNPEGKVVFHCQSGKRAASVVDTLEREFKLTNLYNLEGGIAAYKEQIDNSIEII